MEITCPNCGQTCEVDEEPATGRHLLCPFCDVKFNYTSQNTTENDSNSIANTAETNVEEPPEKIQAICQNCGAVYEVDAAYIGETATCGTCNSPFVIKAVRETQSPDAPADAAAEKAAQTTSGATNGHIAAKSGRIRINTLRTKAKSAVNTAKDTLIPVLKTAANKTKTKAIPALKSAANAAKIKTVALWQSGKKGKVSICAIGTMAVLLVGFWMFKERDTSLIQSGEGLNYAPSQPEERKRTRMVVNHPCVQLWADGPYWAETNIGATSPEETGLYFWWGDAKGQMPSSGSFRVPFSKDNCPTADKSESDLKNEGWLTGGGILAPAHDAAHAHWGDSWRMPTKQDFQNLLDNCHWVWTFRNGVGGYVIRGKGAFSGESIFLPCTCDGIGNSLSRAYGSCNYWSSDRNSLSIYFDVGWRDVGDHFQFWVGLPIRPVTSRCNRTASELRELENRIKNEQVAQSEYVMGLRYELGSGSDMREAFECYRRAAELGSAEAQFKLGSLYRDGKGVKRDSQKSVAWFRKAAEQGLPIAQFSLGCRYKTGGGVKKNEFTAADWFEKAARQGYAPAQYLFGDCFDFGRGVICTSTDGNPREAVKWFRLAAKQGLADAQFRLGCCYLLGRGVYEEDPEEAIKWLGKAAAQGHGKAQEMLRQCR